MNRTPIVAALALLVFALPAYAADVEIMVRAASAPGTTLFATAQLRRDTFILEEHLVGSNGRVEFRGLSQGTYSVRVRAEGFQEEEVSVLIVRPNSREVIRMELRPLPPDPAKPNRGSLTSVYDLQIPDSAKREFERGLKDRDDKDGCKKAAPRFEKAISLYAQYANAHHELGKCRVEAAQFDQAIDSFHDAIRYGNSIFPYISLSDVYLTRKRPEEARQILRDGIAKFPDEGDLRFALAKVYYDLNLPKDAEKSALEAHSRFHRAADVHLLLAKIYLAAKAHADVVTQLKLYLEENPKGPLADRVRQNLAEVEGK
jgi:tetratricopeptide (TPR) repeat protein